MTIEIRGVTKEEVAFDKEITFTYEGESYSVTLHWDNCDGYDLTFNEVDEPEWATNWEDNNEQSLSLALDSLTDEALEIGAEL